MCDKNSRTRAQQPWLTGLAAWRHVRSSQIRDQTGVQGNPQEQHFKKPIFHPLCQLLYSQTDFLQSNEWKNDFSLLFSSAFP